LAIKYETSKEARSASVELEIAVLITSDCSHVTECFLKRLHRIIHKRPIFCC
jgi:hypothetical protein